MLNVLSPLHMKSAEKYTIGKFNISALELVEKAGEFLASTLLNSFPNAKNILVIAGVGNNGADGLCASRHLALADKNISIILKNGNYSPENQAEQSNINRLRLNNIKYTDSFSGDYDVIIDSLYGIGLNRTLDADDINLINQVNISNIPVISADIPSGLNALSGFPMPVAIKSDKVIVFGAMKKGLFTGVAPDYYNSLLLNGLGIVFTDEIDDWIMFDERDLPSFVPYSRKTAHKGTYGKSLIIAGSDKIYGAAFLCAKSAFNSGAGMVKVITHINNKYSFEANLPEAMMNYWDENSDATNNIDDEIQWADTITVGCGLGTESKSMRLLEAVILSGSLSHKILILDADALNLLACNESLFLILCNKIRDCNLSVVMTPHKKELQRLCDGLHISEISDFYKKYKIVLVQKDAKTLVYGNRVFVNNSGNDGMAVAGSGDVLAGILSGLVFRLIPKFDFETSVAICVYIHGLSGDIAALETSKISMTSSDIAASLPKLWNSVIS